MELLKQLFSIHSKSGKEGKIRKFIWNWVRQTVPDAKIECDKPGNLYVTKGKSDTYPCIVAHMDQVQERHSKDFIAYEAEDIIIGFSPKHKEQQGLGADDKCGLWIGLKCLQKFDCLKLAFFVGEEVGCKGSGLANMAFFDDCRFVIEPDRKGITLSNRKSLDSPEELSDTVVIELVKIYGKNHFRLDSHTDSYYIPTRFFHVGTDDELYQDAREGKQQTEYKYDKIVQQIADDVSSLAWFFHKPNLKVLVIAYTQDEEGKQRYKIGPVPKDWYYTVQTLETDINRALDENNKEFPDNYYRDKRPDIFEEKK